MTAQPIDYAEVAKRTNARLAEQVKPGTMPEVVSERRVGLTLSVTGCFHPPLADLIREIAAEVEREKGGGK